MGAANRNLAAALMLCAAWTCASSAGCQQAAMLEEHCVDCHSGDEPSGDFDLEAMLAAETEQGRRLGGQLLAMARRVRGGTCSQLFRIQLTTWRTAHQPEGMNLRSR